MPTDCIEWPMSRFRNGYGRASVKDHPSGRKQVEAHRKAMAEVHGWDALEGMVVMHLCDNRSCINIGHLRIGTQKENLADMTSKGRRWTPRWLDDMQLESIRRLYSQGMHFSFIAGLYGCSRATVHRVVLEGQRA